MKRWRTWATRATSKWDVLLVLFLIGAVVAEVVSGLPSSPEARAAYGVATIACLLVRRTFPLVAIGGVSIGLVAQSLLLESPEEVGVLLSVIVASYTLAVHASRRDAVTGTVLVCMAVAVAVATDPSDSTSNIVPTLLLFVGLPIGLGLTVQHRQRDLETLRLAAIASADEAAEAVEAERRRIARELHDVVSHAVTLVTVQAEAGQSLIARDAAAAERCLAAIAVASRDALIELDRMLHVLRNADDDRPLPEAGLDRVPALVEGARSAGLAVELAHQGEAGTLPAATQACAFRVVQEGLTNALRHAPESTVRVRLDGTGDGLGIEVQTSGRRRASSYGGSGRGLVGLRERVVSLGGSLETDAATNGDFTLRVRLPGTIA
ncbi:MAG: histidine kinase [Actinomycetota bacterium]|nr:histidine kinase [Actinomycetota bacterium]